MGDSIMVTYRHMHRLIVERIGEIKYDISRNQDEREELKQELKEAKEALSELEENKGKYFDDYI